MSENGKLSKFWIHELTRPAFEDWLDKEPEPVVIIGIGSIEQHGPHLPLGMDSLAARSFIHEIAKKSNSVCVHPCWSGYSPHHMAFKGTITLSEDTLLNVILDTISKLPLVRKDPEPFLRFREMADFSLNYRAYVWIDHYTDRYETRSKMTREIYNALNKAKIGIPFPTRTVYMQELKDKKKK